MKANKIKILTVVVLLGGFISANAQDQNDKLNREMTLEREYDPTVQDANKVNRLPELKEPIVAKRSIDYSSFTVPTNPKKEIIILPSGNIMTAIPYNMRRGYFNFGGGMYMNLNGDLGYHILNNGKDKLSVYLTHRSTNGELEYIQWDRKQKAKLNDNLAVLDFNHSFDKSALRLGGRYGYNSFNYYGMPLSIGDPLSSLITWKPDTLANRKTNQVNQVMNAYAGIQSKEGAPLGYLLDFDFLHFAQKYGWSKELDGIRENKFMVHLGVNAPFSNGKQLVGISGKMNLFNYTYPADNNSTNTFGYQNYMEATVTPYYRITGETWNIQLGVNAMLITGDSAKFFASPNISAEAEIADRTVFYATAGGEIKSNDAYGLSRQNRYMDHNTLTMPSRTWLDATLGIRSSIVPDLWFDVFAGYKITENEIFFVPVVLKNMDNGFGGYCGVFQPDASLFRFGASLKYMYQNWIDFSLKGVYNNWSLKEGDAIPQLNGDEKAFGRPSVELKADLTVKPLEPLALSLGYYLGTDRYSLFGGEVKKMENMNDLNFTAAWNFNKTFGAYVKLNNLLFQKQELYFGYPMQRFNAMAGINLNF